VSDTLSRLAAQLREEDTLLSAHVTEPAEGVAAEHGELAASGPRAQTAREDYALLVEAIREGYLLHYGEPRLVKPPGRDLALLAGDYLYALGLERLAALGDLEAVAELSDLISLSAQLHAEGRANGKIDELWRASATVVGAGASSEHELLKSRLRRPPAVAEG
jgi:hypothetical protein